jgi:hypothetical protein
VQICFFFLLVVCGYKLEVSVFHSSMYMRMLKLWTFEAGKNIANIFSSILGLPRAARKARDMSGSRSTQFLARLREEISRV